MTRVKICGVTTLGDALFAANAGANMLGLNLYPPSPRSLTHSQAHDLVRGLRAALDESCPLLVGVFVNEDAETIGAAVEMIGLDLAQLSGDEPPDVLAALDGTAIKALRPRSKAEALQQAEAYLPFSPPGEAAPALILDAYHPELYGGTGSTASIEVAQAVSALTPRLMLAGGLKPENVTERIREAAPWGVDVASGVENGVPGHKDHARMRAFIANTRSVNGLTP